MSRSEKTYGLPELPCADAQERSPIERRVLRYSCPYCGRSRSKANVIASHMFRCWKNPSARRCGTCEHHLPPEPPESPDWITGYPGYPGSPRSCEAGVENGEAMPFECAAWVAARNASPRGNSGRTHA